jgi:hypothetical protein
MQEHIRGRNQDRALRFYRSTAPSTGVAITRNDGVELKRIFNANAGEPGTNVLMGCSRPSWAPR